MIAVAVTQRFAHAFLTSAFVVVPAVVEKVDASIDCRTNNANCQLLINLFQTEMPAANPDCGNLFSRASEYSINHFIASVQWTSPNPTRLSCIISRPSIGRRFKPASDRIHPTATKAGEKHSPINRRGCGTSVL